MSPRYGRIWPRAHIAGGRMRALLLATLQAGITGSGELVLELLDATSRIDELQFARVEGMAHAADIDLQLLAGAARRELVAAAARNLRDELFGMDAVFHGRPRIDRVKCSPKVYGRMGGLTSGLARSDGTRMRACSRRFSSGFPWERPVRHEVAQRVIPPRERGSPTIGR